MPVNVVGENTPILTFKASFELSGITSEDISEKGKLAIRKATAKSAGLPDESYVTYLSGKLKTGRRSLSVKYPEALIVEAKTFVFTVLIAVPIDAGTGDDQYNLITQTLMQSINQQTFTISSDAGLGNVVAVANSVKAFDKVVYYATNTPTRVPTTLATMVPSSSIPEEKSSGLGTGAIIGIAIGALVLLAGVGYVAYTYCGKGYAPVKPEA